VSIAFGTIGTIGTGSTTVSAGLPASLANGDIVLLFVITKPDTATINTPTDWTLAVNVAGGGGTTGNGLGPTRQAVFYRIKDASWSSLPAVSITSGNSSAAVALRYTKTQGVWEVAAASGAYTADGTAWSATMGSNPGITAGDMCVFGSSNKDELPTWSAQAVTATGISAWGTANERTEALEGTTGNDIGGMVFDRPVTTGTASAAAVVTATASSASRGTQTLIRLRENLNITYSPSGIVSGETFPVPSGNPRVLIVHDDPTPNANDDIIKAALEADGMTCTYQSETASPPTDTTTYDVVVHTESGSSTGTTAINAYPTMAVPLVFFETSWDAIRMSTAAATNPTSTTQYDIIETGHAIVAGLSDPFTWRSGASGNYGVTTAQQASGTVQVCAPVGNTGHSTVLRAESGATLTTGTAPARRVCSGIGVGSAPASWDANTSVLLCQMVRWAANVTPGGGHTAVMGGSAITGSPSSISSAEAFGTAVATLSGTLTATPTGIPSGETWATGASNPNLPVSMGTTHVEPESSGYCPPIIDSNGNLYRITESQLAANNQPRAMKSTNGGETWTEMDAANRPGTDTGGIGDLESGWVTWDATDKILTFTWQRSYVAYSSFRTSDHATNPDTWVSNTRENMASVTGSPQYASHTSPTDQSYEWVFYSNGTTKPSYRSRTSAGSYGTQADVDSSGLHPAAILDSNNNSHIIYIKSSQLHYKKLTSGGTLDSSSTRMDSGGVNTTAPIAHAAPQAYVNGGNTYVGALFANGSGIAKFVLMTNGTPGSEETVSASAVVLDPGATVNQSAILSLAVDPTNGTFHAIWSQVSNSDVMYSSRPIGGAWSTPVSIAAPASAPAWVYCRVNTYPNTLRVLSYNYSLEIDDDQTNIFYDEEVLGGGGGPVATIGLPAVLPTGIASAEAFGTHVNTAGALTASPGGVASLEAFGTAVKTSGALTSSPGGIASLEAFGTHVNVAGALTASPGGVATAEAFGTHNAIKTLTASPGGISSAEAFGTVVVVLTLTASPGGIASAEAFGTAVKTSGALTASPGGVASAEAFGTTTASFLTTYSPTGIISLEAFGTAAAVLTLTSSPTGIASAEVFGTANAIKTLTSSPTGVASAEAFGTAAVSTVVTCSPSGIASAEIFGTVSAVLTLTASPSGISSAEAFGTTSVNVVQSFIATGIASLEAFGTPQSVTTNDASPSSIPSAEAFGTPTMTATVTLSPNAVTSAEAFGSVTVALTLTSNPTGITSAEAFGSPTMSSTVTCSPSGVASAEVFGTPAYSATYTASPSSITSAEIFGTTTAILDFVSSPGGIPSAEAFGTPVLVSTNEILPTGIASGETFGTPSMSSTLTSSPSGIGSQESVSQPTATAGTLTSSPTGIPSQQAMGSPTISVGGLTSQPTGIPSAENFGNPLAQFGAITAQALSILSLEQFGIPTAIAALIVKPAGSDTRTRIRVGEGPALTIGRSATRYRARGPVSRTGVRDA
jgi:hypothetical protein